MAIEISYDNFIETHENLFYSLIWKIKFVCVVYMHIVGVGCINMTIVCYVDYNTSVSNIYVQVRIELITTQVFQTHWT